jgi:hypothetical protein
VAKYLISLILLLVVSQAWAYDFGKDFTIMQDKLSGPTLFTEPPKKYFINLDANLITGYNHLKDEAHFLEDNPTEQNVNNFLDEHTGSIKSADAKIDVGVALGEFHNYEKTMSWLTQLQFHAHWSLSAAIKNETLSRADIVNQFPKTLPPELLTFVESLPAGTDIISACRNSTSLSLATTQFCNTFPTGVYFIPSSYDVASPTAYYFYKEDYKFGSYNYWNYQSFFGGVNLYLLRRQDQLQILNGLQLQSGEDFLQWKRDNTTDYLALDYTLGWRKKNHAIALNFTEIRLATLHKPPEEVRPLAYGTRTQFNLQEQSHYDFSGWSLMHFEGLTNTGYNVLDGMYVGFVPTYHLGSSGDVSCLFMVDSYFYTLGPQYTWKGLNIQYQYKMPSNLHTEDLKPDAIQSLSLGFSF